MLYTSFVSVEYNRPKDVYWCTLTVADEAGNQAPFEFFTGYLSENYTFFARWKRPDETFGFAAYRLPREHELPPDDMHFAFYLEDKNLGDKRISIFELEHYLESNDGRLPDNILLSDLARLYLVYKTIPFLTKIRGDKEIYPFDERKNQTPSNWQEAIACYMEDHENENHGPKEFRFNLLSERGQAAFDAFLHPTDDVM